MVLSFCSNTKFNFFVALLATAEVACCGWHRQGTSLSRPGKIDYSLSRYIYIYVMEMGAT
jgi:hypothetical protein